MQTTLEIPKDLMRQIEQAAANAGQSAATFVVNALQSRLEAAAATTGQNDARPWLRLAGVWKDYATDLKIVEAEIEDAFEQVEEEMWV